MTFDVTTVRAQYPALADGRVWLDGAAGTQVPHSVIDAITHVYRAGVSNQGAPFAASARGTRIVADARAAVADLVGADDPTGVLFGPTMTALTYRLATAFADTWGPGDEIVVTELDHDANVRPWVQAAQRVGATVRWARADPSTATLPVDAVAAELSERTRLVAVTAASNLVGTRPDIPAITAAVHEVGAFAYVDGVHHCPHSAVDVGALGADLYATSAYKWAGPHLAAVVAADPAALAALRPDKLLPSPDAVPERFELGTNSFAALAGVTAAVEHLAGLDQAATGDRRARLVASRAAVNAHEDALGDQMVDGLTALPGVQVYGPSTDRTPTAYFRVAGHTPAELAAALSEREINCWNGHAYAWELARVLGVRDTGGAVRCSVNHYSNADDVERLLAAVADLA